MNGPISMPSICTIGYENATLAAVIGALKEAGVALLIDIRDAPVSRKPGFSKRMLGTSLEAEGIRYLHLKALGTPKPGRDAAKRGDLVTFHEIYRKQFTTPEAQEAFSDVLALAKTERACLLCYEQDHARCHRDIVADAMAARGFTVEHLSSLPAWMTGEGH